MAQLPSFQLLLALAIVGLTLAVMVYIVRKRISAIGFLRDDFDRRAGWVAFGLLIGAGLIYLGYR